MSSDRTSTPTAPRVAFVQSCWHREIVDACRDGFVQAMAEQAPTAEIDRVEVPGAFELPLHAQVLAKTGRFDAVVAAGFVVDGGIYRHEFVAETVIAGLMRVQLDTGVPVFSSVLTPHHFHDGDVHHAFFAAHMVGKGHEVATACLATCASLARLAATV